MKKEKIKELKQVHQRMERHQYELQRQVRITNEDNEKMSKTIKQQEISVRELENRVGDALSKQIAFKMRNDELSRKLNDLDQ